MTCKKCKVRPDGMTVVKLCPLHAAAQTMFEHWEQIARMTKDGEEDEDGNEYCSENDDNLDALTGLIEMARSIVESVEKGGE